MPSWKDTYSNIPNGGNGGNGGNRGPGGSDQGSGGGYWRGSYGQPPRRGGIGMFGVGMTPAVKWLLIINIVVFVVQAIADRSFTDVLNLSSRVLSGEIWRVFSYMFVHDPQQVFHILSNCLVLFFIGPLLEVRIGTKRFLALYIGAGILAGVFHLLIPPLNPAVGASGATYGILACLVCVHPKLELALFFIPAFRLRLWVIGAFIGSITVLLFLLDLGGMTNDNIAHDIHFAGGLAGVLFAVFVLKVSWQRKPNLTVLPSSRKSSDSKPKPKPKKDAPPSEEEINRILDKIGRTGISSLSKAEREMLERASQFRNRV